jgi:histidine triad (HIT) family protein
MPADCVFCRIVAGEAPATVVAETDGVVAFRDIRPRAPTHVLLVPKEHIASAAHLGAEHGPLLAELFQVAARVAREEGVDRSGWRLVTNVGPAAGQSVYHLHFHLLGGRSLGWPPG